MAPESFRLGIVRGISYGVFGPPGTFMPELRALGGRVARVYFTWNQVEPEPGRYDWTAVDALLAQLEPDDAVWVTVVSASRWATETATDFLPGSPATAPSYALFVGALVSRCRGRVQFWQCNNEPSNPGLWAGSAEAYAAQARSFADAVRSADPAAQVVLGGCGYDVLSSPQGSPARTFFDTVLGATDGAWDLFDLHLYDDPRAIDGHVEAARAMMRAHWTERPVVVGEYGGPTLLQFPELEPEVMHKVMAEAFAGGGPSLDSTELAKGGETPDRRAMRLLYERMPELPAKFQMFMQDCAPDLAAKRDRIACREMVTRPLLAFAAGARLALCWNLAPEVPGYRDRFNLMGFLSDKLALLDFDGDRPVRKTPAAEAHARFAAAMDGAVTVSRRDMEPGLVAIDVDRGERGPLLVVWVEAGAFDGDALPPSEVECLWLGPPPRAVDAFGTEVPVVADGGVLRLSVAATPVLISNA